MPQPLGRRKSSSSWFVLTSWAKKCLIKKFKTKFLNWSRAIWYEKLDMRLVSVISDYLVKLVIPASRAIVFFTEIISVQFIPIYFWGSHRPIFFFLGFESSTIHASTPRVGKGTISASGVRSLKDLWEGDGKSHSHNSDTVMGTGRELGIFLWQSNLPASAGNFFFENR